MIQTTHGKAYAAYIALSQIRGMVKGMDALHVFHMKNMLREPVEFLGEEERRIIEGFGGVIAENGIVLIPDEKKRREHLAARKELDEMPCDVQTDPITIRIDRCPDVTGEQIEMLDGFVIFEEEVKESNGDE